MQRVSVSMKDRRGTGPPAPRPALFDKSLYLRHAPGQRHHGPGRPAHHFPGRVTDEPLRGARPTDHPAVAVDHRNRSVGHLSKARRPCEAVSENFRQRDHPSGVLEQRAKGQSIPQAERRTVSVNQQSLGMGRAEATGRAIQLPRWTWCRWTIPSAVIGEVTNHSPGLRYDCVRPRRQGGPGRPRGGQCPGASVGPSPRLSPRMPPVSPIQQITGRPTPCPVARCDTHREGVVLREGGAVQERGAGYRRAPRSVRRAGPWPWPSWCFPSSMVLLSCGLSRWLRPCAAP